MEKLVVDGVFWVWSRLDFCMRRSLSGRGSVSGHTRRLRRLKQGTLHLLIGSSLFSSGVHAYSSDTRTHYLSWTRKNKEYENNTRSQEKDPTLPSVQCTTTRVKVLRQDYRLITLVLNKMDPVTSGWCGAILVSCKTGWRYCFGTDMDYMPLWKGVGSTICPWTLVPSIEK